MTGIPADALAAAQKAMEDAMADPDLQVELSAAGLSRVAVEAAAPYLADAIAKKIIHHMETHGPDAKGSWHARNAWRRHLRIAAQVAGLALTTKEDRRRMAAEALAKGDVVVCGTPATESEESR